MSNVLVASSVFSAISTLFVALRFYTRLAIIHSPGNDDYMILASVVCASNFGC